MFESDDEALWLNFTQGCDRSFSIIYDKYIDSLYAYGKRYLPDDDMLKDCIQELFIDLLSYRRSLAKAVNIKFYLFKSLRRKVYSVLKKCDLRLLQETSYADFTLGYFNLDFNAEQLIIHAEEEKGYLSQLAEQMNLLPDRQKEILYLKYNSGFEYEKIAGLLGISVNSCRTMIYRSIKQLRKALQETPAQTATKNLLTLISA